MFFFCLFIFAVYIIQSQLFETQIFLNIVVRAFLYYNAVNNTFANFSKRPLLYFTSSKIWYVIPPFSQNRPRHRCLSSFFQYFFEILIGRISLCALLSFLAGTSRLILTCYKTNSSKSRDGFNNPATSKKDFFWQFLFAKIVYFCLRNLVSDVPRLIKFDIE